MHVEVAMDYSVSMRGQKVDCSTKVDMDVSIHRAVARETAKLR